MVTVECRKCGCQQQTAVDDVIKGMNCPNCHAALRLDDGTAISVYNIDEPQTTAECPSCRNVFAIPGNPHEPLFCCSSCHQVFLRKPLPDFVSGKSSWSNSEIILMLEVLHREKAVRDEDELLNHTGKILSMLGIKASEEIGERIYPLLQAIMHLAERQMVKLYCNYPSLPSELRLRFCCRIAASPLMPAFFSGSSLEREEIAPFLKEVLKDDLLYEQLSSSLIHRHFMLISTYILEFVIQIYGVKVDRETLNLLTLSAIAHGLEDKICDSGYFVYLSESDIVRPTSDLNLLGRREFYTKDDEINRELHRICACWGIRKRIRWGRMWLYFGLTLLAMIFLGIIIYYQKELLDSVPEYLFRH